MGKTSRAIGTHGFMAPEMILGGRVGPTADVYGLGRTLGWLASGTAPDGVHAQDVREPWVDLVERMTAFDPRDRVQTMRDVVVEVDKVVAQLRQREAARWKERAAVRLNARDEHVLALLVERASDADRAGRRPRVTSYDATKLPVPPLSRRVSVRKLISLGYLVETEIESRDGYEVAYEITDQTWQWADAGHDRLLVLIEPPPLPSPPPDDDIPF